MLDARRTRRQHVGDIRGVPCGRGVTPQASVVASCEHAVEHERVKVDVEIERATDARHDRHGAAAHIRQAMLASAAA